MKEKIMKILKLITTENASIYLIYTGICILVITALSFLIIYGGWYQFDSNRLDHFGSFISGVVGSLWSLASFILLYVSLQQQKADIKLANQALTLQIEEFKGTKIALEEQNKTQQLQQFETTFFNLLGNYRDLLSFVIYTDTQGNHISRVRENTVYKGKEAFSLLLENFGAIENKEAALKFLQYQKSWNGSVNSYQQLVPYFNGINNIFLFTFNSNIYNKIFYLRLFLSTLNTDEYKLILIHCLISAELKQTIYIVSETNDTFKQFPLYNEIFETLTYS